MQLMTQAEFARHRGVVKSAVSNWKKAGLLVLQEDETGRIKVNAERTDAKLNAKLDPMRGRPPSGSVGGALPSSTSAADPSQALLPQAEKSPTAASEPNLADERQLHLREQRTGQALKNAQMAGELVPLVEAERRLSEAGRAARERIQAWFRGMAERLAAEKDQRTIMALGEEGIDKVFAELAAGAERGDFAADDDPGLSAEETAELMAAADSEA